MSAATFVRMLLSDLQFASLRSAPVDPRKHSELANRIGPQSGFVRAVPRPSGSGPLIGFLFVGLLRFGPKGQNSIAQGIALGREWGTRS